MADVFDPSMDPEEFAIRQAMSRAAALRKQPAPAQGQMVSGHYVRAPKLAGLVPIVNNLVADNIEGNAVQQQQALTGRQREALNEWLSARPTSKTTYGAGDVGPTMTTSEPTEADTTAWAAQGLKNPLSRTLASKVVEDQIVNAPVRAEKAASKKENTILVNQRFDEDRKARAQLAAENSKNRLEMLNARLSTVGADTIARMDLQRQIAREGNELRRWQIESGIEQRALDRQSQEGIAANKLANTPDKPLNEGQSKSLLFGSRMQEANAIFDELADKGVDTSIPGSRTPGIGGVINALQPAEQQRLDQAKRDFINATLRRESGAVISPSEFENGDKQYFPQIGESDVVKAQKKRNREVAMRGVLADVPNADTRVSQVRGQPAPAAPTTNFPKTRVTPQEQAGRNQGQAEVLLGEIRSGNNVTSQADYDGLVRELRRTGYKGEIPPMKIGGASAASPKTMKWSDLK